MAEARKGGKKPKGKVGDSISADQKRGVGRPSKWDDKFLAITKKACELGAIDSEIAEMLGVSDRTIQSWRATNPEFAEVLKIGKAHADDRVKRGLFQRAVGYSHEAVKIFMPAGAETPVYASYIEHVPPDPTAAIFWLKNREPEQWRDRKAIEHSGPDGGPIEVANLTEDQLKAKVQALLAANPALKDMIT